jgi:hypothetical protein
MIHTVTKINIMAAGSHYPGCVLDVLDGPHEREESVKWMLHQVLPLMKNMIQRKRSSV